jgi:uncharacterized protein (DUF1697 family)
MTQCIALFRGINVGHAKRIAMDDLRKLMEDLGFSNVNTLLNSGNAVFEASKPKVGEIASNIEASVQKKFGFPVKVVVVKAGELSAIIEANPLPQSSRDPSKFFVAFAASAGTMAKAKPLLADPWTPEVLALGKKAAYLWCPDGIIESKLARAFGRVTGDEATMRNWATVLKLHAITSPG